VLFFVQGDNLFQTLLLNWITYDDYSPIPRQTGDAPAWEMDNPYEPKPRTIPKGYLDYLTWQNRRVWFKPEQVGEQVVVREMTMAPGLKMESGVANPLIYYRIDEKRGALPLRFSEARALWRDSSALFRLRHEGHRPPEVFNWLASLESSGYLQPGQRRRILALGMANDQAKTEFFRADRMPLRSEYLQEKAMVDKLDDLLKLADQVARQVWGAASTLASYLVAPEQDSKTENTRKAAGEDVTRLTTSWGIERTYWSQLETPFRTVLTTLPDDPDQAANDWKTILRRAAWSAFDTVGDNLDPSPRALKAVVNAQGQLRAGLAKMLPD
jgi:CRISPR system Cascade subunit CasA